MSSFSSIRRIGSGIYASVYTAWHNKLSHREVLKVLRITAPSNDLASQSSAAQAALKAALRELLSLRALHAVDRPGRQHIVNFYGYFIDQGAVVLRLEHLDADLSRLIDLADDMIHIPVVARLAADIFAGIGHAHTVGIALRDIKTNNIAISRASGRAKLIDFGLSRAIDAGKTPSHLICGNHADGPDSREVFTRWYRPVETLLGSKYTASAASDIWSAGLVLGELLNHGPLFPGISDINQLFLIYEALGQPTVEDWPELRDMKDYGKVSFIVSGDPVIETDDAKWRRIVPRATPKMLLVLMNTVRMNPNKRITAERACAMLLEGEVACWRDVAVWVKNILQ